MTYSSKVVYIKFHYTSLVGRVYKEEQQLKAGLGQSGLRPATEVPS